MTPQSVGLVRAERRLVEEFYNCPLHVNAGLILAPFLSQASVRRIRSRKLLNGKSSWRTWCVASAESISLKMVTWCCRRIREPWRISPPAVPKNSADGCTNVTTVLNLSGFFTAAAIGLAPSATESRPNSGSQNGRPNSCHVTTITPLRPYRRNCEAYSNAIRS